METNFLGPYPKHPPKRYHDGENIRDHELRSPLRRASLLIYLVDEAYHILRRDFPVPLDIPKAERTVKPYQRVRWKPPCSCSDLPCSGSDSLREPEVCDIQKRELEVIVLTDGHQGSCGVETLRIDESQHGGR